MTKQGARLQHCSRGSRKEVKADDEAARREVEDWSKQDDASGWGAWRRELPLSFDCLCVRRRAPRFAVWCRGGGDTVVAAAVTCDMSLYVCEKVSQKE